jgi:hypothetical protein
LERKSQIGVERVSRYLNLRSIQRRNTKFTKLNFPKSRKNDTQRELEDFTDESRQLEAELEASLTQSERQVRELKQTLNNMTLENESLKVR